MNDVITLFIKDKDGKLGYNPMYKFNNADDFFRKVEQSRECPGNDDIVVEGYRGDNLVAVNETFSNFVYKMKLIFGLL